MYRTFGKPLFYLFTIACWPVLAQPQDQAQPTPQDQTQTVDTGSSDRSVNHTPNPLEDPRDRVYYPGDTERIKPLGVKLFGNVLLDQKQIWTSPFHMNRSNAKWWIGFAAVTGALIATDRRTSHVLENSTGQVLWGNRVSNIGASYTLIPLTAGFYGFGAIWDDPKARETGVLGAETLLDSLIVVEVLKPIAGRNRPDSKSHPGNFFSGGDSFPSGHSIETWSLASLIAHEYSHSESKWVPWVAYGLSGVVSAARITAQRHYASDVVAGGVMGWFIGRYVYKTHVDHAIHKHGWLEPKIVPRVEPGTNTYSLALVFN
jgi:membrane-associated phospholipid phosphatase